MLPGCRHLLWDSLWWLFTGHLFFSCRKKRRHIDSSVLFPVIDDSAPNLLCLLLLAELMVHSSCRPASGPALCSTFKSIFHQMDVLMRLSRKLHGVVRRNSVMWIFMYPNVECRACLPLLETGRITSFKTFLC